VRRFISSSLAARVSAVGAAIVCCGSIASAADLPTKAPVYKAPPPSLAYNWTGFYIGGNTGGGIGQKDWSFPYAPGRTTSHNVSGIIGGAQIGYNYQVTNLVIGVEGEYGAAGIKGDSLCPNAAYTCTSKIFGVASVTGRIGYAFPAAVLAYAKGGAAWAREDFTAISATASEDTGKVTTTGWTVGGGLEYGFWGRWSARVEYDYYDFGTKRRDAYNPAGVLVDTEDVKQRLSTVKLGINYRF
jgi:outer membrane immunogenic protein